MRKWKFPIVILTFLFIILLGVGFWVVFKPNTAIKDQTSIFIPSGSSYNDVLTILSENKILSSTQTFTWLASLMNYNDRTIRPGKYNIKPGMTNRQLIRKLRSGNQDPVKLVLNNIRFLSDLAGKASHYLEVDSLSMLQYLREPKVFQQYGFDVDNFLTMFIPNTYQIFWTASPQEFVDRMKKEFDTYWNKERLDALETNQLTPTSAYILASIVEKESNYNDEKSRIAGVYLNRLKNGIKLQADPTVVYAMGDFSILRVLHSHLTYDSPYNTYLNEGLPPGPICMPSLQSLEAVIHAEQHDFVYFCAKADNSGAHAFAVTYQEHLRNADAFARWLNERNIK